ncbi:hypothetical protein BR93DRAFT_952066 [Coniochaeta sp. PMI_546]|nr:hypothetical protein BR93DRAFT_952066 [Coniochaeta sp. PMI_546]
MNQHGSPTSAPNSRRVPRELRQRTERSCDRCKSRKQKCSKWPDQEKCQHCQKYGYDCVVTKPRKQRIYGSVETHGAKLALLESLVKGLMPEADLSNVDSMQEMASSLGIPVPERASSGAHDINVRAAGEAGNDEDEQLVHDLQGQDQYIGRASSYIFQMTLRGLFGSRHSGPAGRMYLFGPNPANNTAHSAFSRTGASSDEALDIQSITSASPPNCGPSSSAEPSHTDQSLIFSLVRAFFDRVNADFPVLHEATFLEQLDAWCRCPTAVDRVWICSFLCVLILGRRHSSVPVTEEQEESWWCRIQSHLSKVMFTSSLASIQVLMLTALHLHNTNSRDICWTLTGAAIRISFAIGLHRDGVEIDGTPLAREMRKRVWWTLYAFEQLQVSSHDRPSAIDSPTHLSRSPRETILGMGTHSIPDYLTWSSRLVVLLGSACRALPDVAKDGYSGPLSPAAGLLRDLMRWRSALPQHLSMESIDTMPPSFQRPLILLHVQHHYIVCSISRYALLSRFTSLSKDCVKPFSDSLGSVSDACIESGRLSCRMLLKLESAKDFNAVTWLDVIICDTKQERCSSTTTDRMLLSECRDLATKHLRNPMVPGTMRRWLDVVGELNTMVAEFTSSKNAKSPETASAPADEEISRSISSFDPAVAQTSLTTALDHRRKVGTYRLIEDQRDLSWGVRDDLGFSDVRSAPPMPALLSPSESSFDPIFHIGADPTEAQFWQELHWEGISDMLLGMETKSRLL